MLDFRINGPWKIFEAEKLKLFGQMLKWQPELMSESATKRDKEKFFKQNSKMFKSVDVSENVEKHMDKQMDLALKYLINKDGKAYNVKMLEVRCTNNII